MLTGKMSSRCKPRQTRASSLAVATVCGRDATKAAFGAPAEVPTSRSDSTLLNRPQHPNLEGSQAGAAGKDEAVLGTRWAVCPDMRSVDASWSRRCHLSHHGHSARLTQMADAVQPVDYCRVAHGDLLDSLT